MFSTLYGIGVAFSILAIYVCIAMIVAYDSAIQWKSDSRETYGQVSAWIAGITLAFGVAFFVMSVIALSNSTSAKVSLSVDVKMKQYSAR
jgi:hypothetical protein